MYSVSPITQKQYAIPTSESDIDCLERFLQDKQGPVVVVQGLGFVGSAMSLVVSNSPAKYSVIGVDLKNEHHYWKIASINEGVAPLESSDPKISCYMKKAFNSKSFFATFDAKAYSFADVIIVDINLDVKKVYNQFNDEIESYNVELEPFRKAIRTIGENCKNNCLVLVETTVPPGTCEKVVLPILKEEISKRGLEFKVKIGHSYERVMPGEHYLDSIENFYRVFSGIDEESAQAVEAFLKTVIRTDQYPLTRLKNTTATEMAKVMENSYRAMNIAFIDDWARFAQISNVDLNEVISSIKIRPTHNNIMRPGLGVGGYCLTKDPLIASWSCREFFGGKEMLWLKKSVEVNDKMPLFSFEQIKNKIENLKDKRVLLLGVSYLGNVGDTRYTPVEPLYNKLVEENAKIKIHDPFVKFWTEKNLHIDFMEIEDIDFDEFDLTILCTNHFHYKNNEKLISALNKRGKKVFDLNFCLSENDKNKLTEADLTVLGNFFRR